MTEGPHDNLVNRFLDAEKALGYKRSDLFRVKVTNDIVLDIEKIAVGAYSPLKGFMSEEDFESVVTDMRLVDGTTWTVPVFLPVCEKTAGNISKGDSIIIQNQDSVDVAVVEVSDIYTFPKDHWAEKVYGTQEKKHPGVNRLFDMHDKLIGGNIWMIERPKFEFEKNNLDPVETRRQIKERGWKTVAGFQTRNIPHRAHEYLQKLALSFVDGLLIHPIIGWKKDGDFNPGVIIKAYETLIEAYYPKGSVIFSGLATSMRYAGPREAVFHALIRKNYGCTHFIVGRDHAGVGGYYEKYDAHRIFDELPDIGINIMALRGPGYCRKCGEIVTDKICPHSAEDHADVSGTLIRKLLSSGGDIPDYLLRPEVAEAVRRFGKEIFI